MEDLLLKGKAVIINNSTEREMIEDRIKVLKNKYKNIINLYPILFLVDEETGNYVYKTAFRLNEYDTISVDEFLMQTKTSTTNTNENSTDTEIEADTLTTLRKPHSVKFYTKDNQASALDVRTGVIGGVSTADLVVTDINNLIIEGKFARTGLYMDIADGLEVRSRTNIAPGDTLIPVFIDKSTNELLLGNPYKTNGLPIPCSSKEFIHNLKEDFTQQGRVIARLEFEIYNSIYIDKQ